ncbi:hypothetical protein BD779DRAFT_860912 [Infundibulicybe gibba]|nr:hypothetical protein BD779DRAFT_860912 [Infundibulicybe gibba]
MCFLFPVLSLFQSVKVRKYHERRHAASIHFRCTSTHSCEERQSERRRVSAFGRVDAAECKAYLDVSLGHSGLEYRLISQAIGSCPALMVLWAFSGGLVHQSTINAAVDSICWPEAALPCTPCLDCLGFLTPCLRPDIWILHSASEFSFLNTLSLHSNLETTSPGLRAKPIVRGHA